MKERDFTDGYESPHDMDYDHLLEHIVMGDHEILRLDAALRDAFSAWPHRSDIEDR
jgi:hypothetical protein